MGLAITTPCPGGRFPTQAPGAKAAEPAGRRNGTSCRCVFKKSRDDYFDGGTRKTRCTGKKATHIAGADRDFLGGLADDDVISGGAGSDFLYGGSGEDWLGDLG